MDEISWQDFGDFLQQVRRRRGVSQERLAELMDYHRIHTWRLEHGERHPSKQFLRVLADAITLTPAEMKQLAVFRQMILYHCESAENTQLNGQAEGRKEGRKEGLKRAACSAAAFFDALTRQHGGWRCKQPSSCLVNSLLRL